jgi:hypothetical protein
LSFSHPDPPNPNRKDIAFSQETPQVFLAPFFHELITLQFYVKKILSIKENHRSDAMQTPPGERRKRKGKQWITAIHSICPEPSFP